MKSGDEVCYLVRVRSADKKRLMVVMAKNDNVLRVTDHGPHVKVVSRGPLTPLKGLTFTKVPDKTKHWDVMYWDFAMQVFRRAIKKRQKPDMAIGVLVHYLCNLMGQPEELLLRKLAANRAYIDAAISDEEAHGWEMKALRKP